MNTLVLVSLIFFTSSAVFAQSAREAYKKAEEVAAEANAKLKAEQKRIDGELGPKVEAAHLRSLRAQLMRRVELNMLMLKVSPWNSAPSLDVGKILWEPTSACDAPWPKDEIGYYSEGGNSCKAYITYHSMTDVDDRRNKKYVNFDVFCIDSNNKQHRILVEGGGEEGKEDQLRTVEEMEDYIHRSTKCSPPPQVSTKSAREDYEKAKETVEKIEAAEREVLSELGSRARDTQYGILRDQVLGRVARNNVRVVSGPARRIDVNKIQWEASYRIGYYSEEGYSCIVKLGQAYDYGSKYGSVWFSAGCIDSNHKESSFVAESDTRMNITARVRRECDGNFRCAERKLKEYIQWASKAR